MRTFLAAAAIALCALAATPASAQQTYTWSNGAGTNLWSTGSNWLGNPTLTFNNQTDIVFNSASVVTTGNTVAIGANRTIRSLTINANYATADNATFDIATRTSTGAGNANLTFQATSGSNASITVAQSTSGAAFIRLGVNNTGTTVLSSNLDLVQNNTFLSAQVGFSFDGRLSGTGAINKSGAGEVRFVRNNSLWSGGVNINEGNVSAWNDGTTMGTGTWTLAGGANNTSLSVGSAVTHNNTGGIVVASGAGTRTIQTTGTAVATGNPTLNGNVTLNKDATLSIQSFTAGTNDQMTLSGTVSGVGGIGKTNTGTLILTGNNTYTGLTTISGGTLSIGSGGTTGSVAGNITNNAGLIFNRSDALTYSGTIGGTGGLTKQGAGQLTFTGSNSYSGVTTISGGTLSIGSGATSGSIAGNVANNAALLFNRSDAVTFANVISGNGTVTKLGAGLLNFTGSNTYTGLTSVNEGSLAVNGSVASAVNVANAATLGGAGTINGLVTVAGGGILAPGNSPGTLTMTSGLSLADSSILNFELSPTNFTVGGGINDLIVVSGGFTLDGILNVTGIGTNDFSGVADYTTWRLFNYSGGTFTNNTLALGTMPTVGGGDRYFKIDTDTTGQVNLVIVPEPGALILAGLGIAAAVWARRRK